MKLVVPSLGLALAAAACAPSAAPLAASPVTVAAAAPAPAPAAESAPLAPSSPPRSVFDEAKARTFYTLDVTVVPEPPPAVHLLADLDEGAANDCEGALLTHARQLGANRLWVNHEASGCKGSAYMVPPRPQTDEDYGWALHRWLRERWKRPSSLTDEQLRQLCVVTTVWTTSTLHLWKVAPSPARSSGNPAFDESVRALLEHAVDEKDPLPTPPSVEASRAMRHASVRVSFTVGDTARCR